MNALTLMGVSAQEVAASLVHEVQLDRPATRQLLRALEKLDSAVAGCAIMQAGLRMMLARKDWLVISIVVDPATVRVSGAQLGIVKFKPAKKPGLSPMQKYQTKKGLRR